LLDFKCRTIFLVWENGRMEEWKNVVNKT
jgi:hypothetical protein